MQWQVNWHHVKLDQQLFQKKDMIRKCFFKKRFFLSITFKGIWHSYRIFYKYEIMPEDFRNIPIKVPICILFNCQKSHLRVNNPVGIKKECIGFPPTSVKIPMYSTLSWIYLLFDSQKWVSLAKLPHDAGGKNETCCTK